MDLITNHLRATVHLISLFFKLVEFYNKAIANGANFEIVFVSSDRDEKSFQDYFGEMPWKALPFAEREKKQEVSSKFKVQGIPTLIFLDAVTGDVKNKNGREIVSNDPEGKNFPWIPKSFQEVRFVSKV